VEASTFLAFGSIDMISKGCVTPLPAVAALGNVWVHESTSNCSYVLPEVKRSVDEGFSFGAVLRVPDVNPDNRHVRVFGSADNAET